MTTSEDPKRKYPPPPHGGPSDDAHRGTQGRRFHPGDETPDDKPRPADGPDANLQADTEKSIDELASLQEELEKAKDHALRCRAEMENFKKRLTRQVEEERRYTCLPIMKDLLPVLDNMDRAIDAAAVSEGGAGLREGFQMVAQQLRGVLAKYDCLEIDALGKPFDPNLHEAVSQVPSAEAEHHTVLAVVEPGFQLHDRVVRPTKVIVSTRPDDEDP